MRELLDKTSQPQKPARVEAALEPDIWVEPHYVLEIRADELTRSPMHTAGRGDGLVGYALRFPRVINFIREDKAPEDATSEQEVLEMYARQRRKGTEETSG